MLDTTVLIASESCLLMLKSAESSCSDIEILSYLSQHSMYILCLGLCSLFTVKCDAFTVY